MNKLVKYIIEQKFNFNIDQLDIEDNEGEFSLSKQQYKPKSMKQEYIENSLFVDLGLPSGTLWCKYNLGCDFTKLMSEPENTISNDWIGDYYAWGEIEPKNEYSWETYKHGKEGSLTKYCNNLDYGKRIFDKNTRTYSHFIDNLRTLEPEDDVATKFFNNPFIHIPTFEQVEELITLTTLKKINNYKNIQDLNGFILASNLNDNYIFIPFTGFYTQDIKQYITDVCSFWTSSQAFGASSYIFDCEKNDKAPALLTLLRKFGLTIRAVKEK